MTPPAALIARIRGRHDTIGWLWICVGAVGLFTLVAILANAFTPAARATRLGDLGHDFLAFYSAGRVVDTGNVGALYDLDALQQVQHSIAEANGIANVAPPVAPWWNPPHVALPFAPLSRLPFYSALAIWSAIGLTCLLASAGLLATLFSDVAGVSRRVRWLIPAALLAAPPTLQAFGHGQNTFVSLLMVSLVVVAWRRRLPMAAGLACALLFYKPQLAMLVSVALIGTLGWRVCIGLMLGMVPQALACVTLLPDALGDFFSRVPATLRHVQFEQAYLWHRHVTFNGFWHFALQGNGPGATSGLVTLLSFACVAGVGIAIVVAWWRLRRLIDAGDAVALDRFIAAALIATPLLMPFFFDYDLLLLCVAGVLIGREMMVVADRSRTATTLRYVGVITFGWTMWNPAFAELFKLNLTVPLLSVLLACQTRRCLAYAASASTVAATHDISDDDTIDLDDLSDWSGDRLAA